MEYKVYIHPTVYKETIVKLPEKDQLRIKKLTQQLTSNPYVGNILQIKSIREKRLNGKRIFYIVFEDLKIVLIVAISDKKTQQKTIDSIRTNMNVYRGYAKNIGDED